METTDFRNRVLGLYSITAPLSPSGYGLQQAWLLAPGIMLVLDWLREYDLYFDPELWAVRFPEYWPPDVLMPPDLIDTGLLVIELNGHKHIIRDVRTARQFAQAQLMPTATTPEVAEFYPVPWPVDLAHLT